MRKTIPFSVDITGNFAYSQALMEARQLFNEGAISSGDLLELEDKEIQRIVDNCKSIGLKCVTDGHYRTNGYLDFFNYLENISISKGETEADRRTKISGKIGFDNYFMSTTPMTEHFTFLTGIIGGDVYAKALLPSPATLFVELIRPENKANTGRYYPSKDLLIHDIAETYRKVIAEFYDMGCRFLQFSDFTWNLTGGSNVKEVAEAHGTDLVTLASTLVHLMEECLVGKPDDMFVVLEFNQGWWSAGYKTEMAQILGSMNAKVVALDFGDRENEEIDFSILNFCQGKEVILELVSTTNNNPISPSILAFHVENAARFIPLESLHLGCRGNFRDLNGNSSISESDMWNKIASLKSAAIQIWGE